MSNSKTTWAKIVSDKELSSAKKLRGKTFVVDKVRTIALPEYIEEGWTEYRRYKNPKDVGIKKEKRFDELFEDKVWSLFANMGFNEMNSDRHFAMSYDYHNPNSTQQIDVFAADDETVIIVECKSADKIKSGIFKKPIEAFRGQMDGLRREAQQRYPGCKVKFIWATHNYIMSKPDLEKLSDAGIAYFGDATVNYYIELTKHLGSSAKYQLLGNLFAHQEIRNMNECIPAIQGKMGGFTYYSFSIEPERLLKIGYVLHRNEANKNMMPTYQRLIKKKRLTEVQSFIDKGGYFPNSLIISLDSNGKGLKFDVSSMRVEGSISRLGILHLPKRYRSAYIIDGQHRLYGYSDSPYSLTNSIPVVAFVDLDRTEQIKLFMDINENQKAVPKTLRVTLDSDMLWESSDHNKRRQALRSKIAQMLGEEDTSPLLDRVIIGENESSPIRCITVGALQLALKRCQYFSQFKSKDIVSVDGTFDLGTNLQATCDLFYSFLEKCLIYVKENCDSEWSKGDTNGGILTINRGLQATIRVIDDIINHLIKESDISPKTMSPDALFLEVCYYLDPLLHYISNITPDQRKDLTSRFGGGAETWFWRTFQKAVADARPNFSPEGMREYWENQAKTFNDESMHLLQDIERTVKNMIETSLSADKGDNWLILSAPKSVYTRAKKEADDQAYEIISSGHQPPHLSVWDYVPFVEYQDIATNGKIWTDYFETTLTHPDDLKISGGRKAKTDWIVKLSAIHTKLGKPNYSVSNDDYQLIQRIHTWLLETP